MYGIFKNLKALKDETDYNGIVSGEITVKLSDAIDNDFDGFLDLVSEELIGSTLGMSIDYKVLRANEKGELVLLVTLDPSQVIQEGEQEEEEGKVGTEEDY